MSDDRSVPLFLAPLCAERFLVEYWGRRLFVANRSEPSFFHNIVRLSELDRLVGSTRLPLANFNLAQGDAPLPVADYCVGGSFVNKERALALHQAGATIILRSIEQWSPGLN